MSFGDVIYSLLIGPLKLFFEYVYSFAYHLTGDHGLTIIFLSLSINFLILPLYMRADRMQEEEKELQDRLAHGVSHIRRTFKGDERMMILQTYYRQNDYKPTYVLRGAAPLLLEIPFFIAAYSFLSNLTLLQGVSFGPISDLSLPDGLITAGSFTINLMPILMTLINVISSAIFTKGYPLKTKIQLYGMAVFFLIFLYGSPSGLVFYWTLNNLFSLIKTVFYKLKHPREVLCILSSVIGVVMIVIGCRYFGISIARVGFFIGMGALLQIPVVILILRLRGVLHDGKRVYQPERGLFLSGTLFLTILMGLMIPTSVISSSTLEFVSVNRFYGPLWYMINSVCLGAGLFLIWFGVFYKLADDRGKVGMEAVICAACAVGIVNYMFFGTDLGMISNALVFEKEMSFSVMRQAVNMLIVLAVIAVFFFIYMRYRGVLARAMTVGVLAVACMSAIYLCRFTREILEFKESISEGVSNCQLPLSTKGRNVVVLMLDRAMGEFIPYIMEEKPELMEEFSGFTYYSNTISYGGSTNFGVPAVYGGYEYTTENMNLRDDMSLMDKHDEALKVMPKLFTDAGYEVTMCDPSYAGYQWIPDLSIYDDIPGIHTYITDGMYVDEELQEAFTEESKRNFFCYAAMKCMPLALQPTFYERGNYRSLSPVDTRSQGVHDKYTADGYNSEFMEGYAVLEHLPDLTVESSNDKGSFIMLTNYTTHEPALLQKDDYVVSAHVDNTAMGDESRRTGALFGDAEDRILHMDNREQVKEYHCNMVTYLKLGEWFDKLRKEGVYDNTRIILVADHGYQRDMLDELLYPFGDYTIDLSEYYPLLMVKDFDASGFTVSDEFMTNADVVSLATDEIMDDPVNPYTGKKLVSDKSKQGEQYILRSDIWNVDENDGNTFLPGIWLSVHDNIWDQDNWKIVSADTTLPEK